MNKQELKSVITELFSKTPFHAVVDFWVDSETGQEKIVVYVDVPVSDLDSPENIRLYEQYDREIFETLATIHEKSDIPVATELRLVA